MFEAQREKLLSGRRADDHERVACVDGFLDAILKRSPEEAQFMRMGDLIPETDLSTDAGVAEFQKRAGVLMMMCSMSNACLDVFGYAKDHEDRDVKVSHAEFQAAIGSGAGRHPVTGVPVENVASVVHIGYALRPEFILQHARIHSGSPTLFVVTDVRDCQKQAVLGVPTLMIPDPQNRDYLAYAAYTALESGKDVVTTIGGVPKDFLLPPNAKSAVFPGSANPERAELTVERVRRPERLRLEEVTLS